MRCQRSQSQRKQEVHRARRRFRAVSLLASVWANREQKECLRLASTGRKQRAKWLAWCSASLQPLGGGGGVRTVSRLAASTSIIPRSRLWQSGGMKCGMWKTPSFTFSSRFLRLSSSNGSAPCRTRWPGGGGARDSNDKQLPRSRFVQKVQTHHQQRKQDDTTAPGVRLPAIVLLALEEGEEEEKGAAGEGGGERSRRRRRERWWRGPGG